MSLFAIIAGWVILLSSCSKNELSHYKTSLESDKSQVYIQEHNYLKGLLFEMDFEVPRFFLFGMGRNQKMIYKNGALTDLEGNIIHKWNVIHDEIYPNLYEVHLIAKGEKEEDTRKEILIKEDSKGIWIYEDSICRSAIEGEANLQEICLPTFNGYKYPETLKVLLHEVLINIKDGIPYPNFLVYHKPFYRDAFIIALCLAATNNSHLIHEWIRNIDTIYDKLAEINEADNLGELLYLISLLPEDKRNKKIIQDILDEANRISVIDSNGICYIEGYTDGAILPIYQTLLLKYGIQKLQLIDSFQISNRYDYYTDLLWMAQEMHHPSAYYNFKYQIKSLYKNYITKYFDYPYLNWAKAHYHRSTFAPWHKQLYPLSWEKFGNRADLKQMNIIDYQAADKKIIYPHAWCAAEMFLYLLEFKE